MLQREPLAVGRKQVVLLLVGVVALVASVPAVSGSARGLLDRSRAATPAVEAMLRRRSALYVLYSLWLGLIASAGEMLYRSYRLSFCAYPSGFNFSRGRSRSAI